MSASARKILGSGINLLVVLSAAYFSISAILGGQIVKASNYYACCGSLACFNLSDGCSCHSSDVCKPGLYNTCCSTYCTTSGPIPPPC